MSPVATAAAPARPHLGSTVRSEWAKLTMVRSTWWILALIVLLGVGITAIICGANADWIASGESGESPDSFITQGMIIAQVGAIALGAVVVTNEYGSGQVISTFAATPRRGRLVAAKVVVTAAVLFVVGTATAFGGYLAGNWFLEREGVGVTLEGDVLRAMYGSGLYLSALGVLSIGVDFVVRHTAAAIAGMLAIVFVLANMVFLIPGTTGEWLGKLMPSNAGAGIAQPTQFDPSRIDVMFEPWTGYLVFLAETTVVLLVAWVLVKRRDA